MDLKIIRSYVEIHYKILFETYRVRHNTIYEVLYKLHNFIIYIKNKINIRDYVPLSVQNKIDINDYVILGNIEYLEQESIVADLIYTIIKNYKLIYELVDTYIYYKSMSAKKQVIVTLKFLIPILTNYINEKEKKPTIFIINSTYKMIRTIIRFILYGGRFGSLIGILLCVLQVI
ncbi:putative integral membrane protein (apicoplast) [Theileria parva strain Muguga]|uniref:Uncharacterized protein n=1 Tax=Theileria parva TaxID=5875 RepID=Q4MY91_THEPA|nr:putative integral membrane protein [Theileria parva strain Muguga]|eukprot:XP_762701.1 hypothetical protein (apicoplast) [Theileria parva strain Muguga]